MTTPTPASALRRYFITCGWNSERDIEAEAVPYGEWVKASDALAIARERDALAERLRNAERLLRWCVESWDWEKHSQLGGNPEAFAAARDFLAVEEPTE